MDKSLYIIKDLLGDLFFPDIDISTDYLTKTMREITVSLGKPVIFYIGDEMYFKDRFKGSLTKNSMDATKVSKDCIEEILYRITEGSPYMYENTLSEGYIPFRNGIRVSVFGEGYTNADGSSIFRSIDTISFRISRVIDDASDRCFKYISDGINIRNTLIVAPPACGKTTLLRSVAKKLSSSHRTGIADERGEICIGDMGLCSMIIKGIPKRKAFDIFVRNASADVIICDEIGGSDDAELLFESLKRGVNVVASIHGESMADIKENPLSKDVYSYFDTIIFLDNVKGKGLINEIYFKGEKQCSV